MGEGQCTKAASASRLCMDWEIDPPETGQAGSQVKKGSPMYQIPGGNGPSLV